MARLALTLFSEPCIAEKRSFDATLPQIEGQIRAIIDLASLPPKTDEDKTPGANDDHYSAEGELGEIQKRNPRGIVKGTGDYERVQQLLAAMRRVSDKAGKPDLPPEPLFSFVPDPDADFKQLYVGFDGPEHPSVTIFDNRQDATSSWLSSAMEPSDLVSALAQVNFDSQILVALAAGERASATAKVFVTDASYNSLLHSFMVDGAVGVNADDCTIGHVRSFPFAVAVAKRPPVIPKFPGYGLLNPSGEIE
jgi:hypothetical protein